MFEAILNDKADFAKLFMENGVSLSDFLTVERLLEFYNNVRCLKNTHSSSQRHLCVLYNIICEFENLRISFFDVMIDFMYAVWVFIHTDTTERAALPFAEKV